MIKSIILLLLIILAVPLTSFARSTEDRLAIQSIIVTEANAVGVDPGLAIFLAAVESDFNPTAKNPNSSAKGIYQWINSSWQNICGGGNVFDPVLNIRCAMQTLAMPNGIQNWTADVNTKNKLIKAGFIDEN